MASVDLTEKDRTLLVEMLCCVIAADKKISGREVQVVVDTLAATGCKPSGGDVKNTVVDFCKVIHKRGVDAYVADLLPQLTSKAGTQVAKLFIDTQTTLLKADGQATSDEKIVSECLVTALQHPVVVDCDTQGADIVLEEPTPAGRAAVATAAKSAVAIAGAAAERTKLLTIALPVAYLTLGKHCAEQSLFCQECPDIYAALGTVAAEMAATSETLSQSSGATTLVGKAQEIAGKGVQLALSKKQALQQQKLLHDLGRKVYETKGISGGPPELTGKLAQIKDRIAVLGESVGNSAQALKQSASAAGKSASDSAAQATRLRFLQSPWLIGISSFLFAPLGLLLIWLHPSWPKRTKYLWASFAVACFCGLAYVGMLQIEATRKSIALADALWTEGKHNDAAEQYHRNVSMLPRLPKSEQAEVYGRLIEYEGGRGNSSKVNPLVESVAEARIDVPAAYGTARRLIAEHQRDLEDRKQAAVAEREQATGTAVASKQAPRTLSRGWVEGIDTYIDRVVTTTLADQEGAVNKVSFKDGFNGKTGNVVFANGRHLRVEVVTKGRDFGWVSSSGEHWARSDDSRYWNSSGQEVSGDEFCKKWKGGQTLMDLRRSQYKAGEAFKSQVIEALKKRGAN